MRRMSVWNGSPGALLELIEISERNNTKRAMLDQRWLDGLLFARYLYLRQLELFPDLLPEMSPEVAPKRPRTPVV